MTNEEMIRRAKMIAVSTGETPEVARRVLLAVRFGNVSAARSAIDLAQYFERDPVWAAREICKLLRKGP